ALASTVLRGERDAVVDGVPGGGETGRCAMDREPADVRAVSAVQQPGELGAPGAEQACETDHLAGVDLQVQRFDHTSPADVDRLEDGVPGAVDLPVGGRRQRLQVVQLATDHHGNQGVAGELADRALADQRAVAQHGDPVGDLVDLVQEVR